jgi:hypothetical protein
VEHYLPRTVDTELDLLAEAPAVSIEGPRAVGKTETALRRANTVYRLDDDNLLDVVRAQPDMLTSGRSPVLIDEWQRMPSSWDLVRRTVDAGPSGPRFLLTGSASPYPAPAHTGAGRIITVRMRPMSIAERALDTPTVSLAGLCSDTPNAISGETSVDAVRYVDEITRSGFPRIRSEAKTLRERLLDGYIDRIIEHEIDHAGRRFHDRHRLRQWMTAYAAASSTSAAYEKIRDAATPGEGRKPAKTTTTPYRTALAGLWMIEELPAWLPTHNHLRHLASAPVHQMADPALAARLLGADAAGLLNGKGRHLGTGPLLGALFQSLVTLSVLVYAQACGARVHHLRTHGGTHEIDLIIQRNDGAVVALEVKFAAAPRDKELRHLRWLKERIGDRLLDAAVITTGSRAYRRDDGIAVVPAALLGP